MDILPGLRCLHQTRGDSAASSPQFGELASPAEKLQTSTVANWVRTELALRVRLKVPTVRCCGFSHGPLVCTGILQILRQPPFDYVSMAVIARPPPSGGGLAMTNAAVWARPTRAAHHAQGRDHVVADQPIDFSIKWDGPATAKPGETIAFTVSVTNNSSTVVARQPEVNFTSALIFGHFANVTAQGYKQADGAYMAAGDERSTFISFKPLGPGETLTISFAALVHPDAPNTDTASITAVITGYDGQYYGPDSYNPTTANVTVLGNGLGFQLTGPDTAAPGDQVTYNLTITNNDAAATSDDGIVLALVADPRLTNVQGTNSFDRQPKKADFRKLKLPGLWLSEPFILGPSATATSTVTATVTQDASALADSSPIALRVMAGSALPLVMWLVTLKPQTNQDTFQRTSEVPKSLAGRVWTAQTQLTVTDPASTTE